MSRSALQPLVHEVARNALRTNGGRVTQRMIGQYFEGLPFELGNPDFELLLAAEVQASLWANGSQSVPELVESTGRKQSEVVIGIGEALKRKWIGNDGMVHGHRMFTVREEGGQP